MTRNMIDIEHLSWSGLRHFKRSPLHYINYILTKGEKTEPMLRGSVTHCLTHEPHKFDSLFVVAPEVDRRTKEGKDKWAEFNSQDHNGKEVVSTSILEQAKPIAESIRNSKAVEFLNRIETFEQQVTWTHDSGIKILSYLDGIGDNFFWELKTCQDASPQAFQRNMLYDGYLHQVALYWKGLERMGINIPCFICAAESSRPYGVSIHRISEEDLEYMYREVNTWIEEFEHWANTQERVGYEYWDWKGYFEYELKRK